MIAFIVVLVVALFSSMLETINPLLGYVDEAIVLVFIVATFVKLLFLEKREVKMLDGWLIAGLILCSAFCIIAFIPNAMVGPYNTFWMQLYTFFGMIKFLLLFYCGRILIRDISLVRSIPLVKKIAWIFTWCCLATYAINLVVPLMQPFDTRFGIVTFSYGFGHPAPFSMVVILFTVMMVFFAFLQKTRMPYVYMLLNLFLVVTAGRSTAVGIYICFFLLLLILPHIRRLPVILFLVLGVFLVWFSWERIVNQFGSENTEARGVLLRTSVLIAKEHSPFGAGLGMFGSHASRLNYSPLYNEYHLSHVWGLSEFNPTFITDSYWAMIIGETGFLGAFLLVCLFLVTLCAIIRSTSGDFKIKLLVVFPFVYALFTSPVDTLLASGSVVSVMLVVIYMMSLVGEVTKSNDMRNSGGIDNV
ncbi:hypothetical protein [Listeria booriae]|uniref:hypothetical protein n=1 Tax=Listeria booriae TaxID=1552123 RepID=UPI00162464C9|nr:hypothetical protein [Listeria booriae]MBC1359559.1 hypothetical protein [Listeria booriae]